MAEDLAAFGFAPGEVAKARGDLEHMAPLEETFEVMAENATAVRLFLALRTQWRTLALSTMSKAIVVQTGLDYAVIKPTADLKGLELVEGDFDRLQIMEAEAIRAFAEEAR